MQTMSLAFVLLSILTATACSSNTYKPDGPSSSFDHALPNALEDTCGAANYRNLLGKPDSMLDDMHFTTPMRLIRPNQPVTMDFRQERINFNSNDKHIITHIHCA
ncbi:I78 family peptidase inhibitor [Acerihabitans sp. TG2]|uniref:I78 family peptidase inhibitor n=1 Tax=Acerihabitans sp. TG2 TaxID=3096008 RepID=UPI002B232FB5|nr:I78 family peptidase inhibitor [Acerihabitans sp. TG2]MEA9393111.1 I78 family peptidase inhibitor [Acerihabitans sp. TG2]